MEKREQLYEGESQKGIRHRRRGPCHRGLQGRRHRRRRSKKKGTIRGKGVVNNRLSNNLMKMLAEKGVPTHFVEELSDRETLVKKVEIVPLEVIIRNVAAGSFTKRLGVPEGTVLKIPTIEFSYKTTSITTPHQPLPRAGPGPGHAGGDRHHHEICLPGERHPFPISAGLQHPPHRLQAGIRPPARRLHRAGRRDQPRHLPLLGRHHGRAPDKDLFRRDLGGEEEAYREVMKRLLGE